MSALKYAFKDIRDHKLIMIIFLVLNIIMFSMLGVILVHIDESRSKIKGLKELRKNTDEAYVLVDTTSEEKFSGLVQDSQGTVKKYNDFFTSLSESELTYYTAYGYDVDSTDKGNTIREQIITEKFLDVFSLSVVSGRLLNKDDFNTTNDTVPIMIGYELQDYYKLGNTYELLNGGNGEYFKGLVVGILSKNSEYYELNSVNVSFPLDYSYIVPQSTKDISNMGFSDLDMAETRMVVFGSKNEIQKIISTKSPIDIKLIGVIDKIDDLLRTHRNEIILLFAILIVIALISVCIMWIFYYHIFKKQFHVYNVHYIFGATNANLYLRFWIISFFIVFVSGVISIAIFHLMPYVSEILISAIVFAAITGSIPVLLIRKKMMR
jgi:hypothetical protein